MAAYYNEHDPYCAAWLRNLIAAGHIAPGDVDERDIRDVRADDVRGYGQCHWFAGIGGWSLALRLAGWDDARSVWTGSPPCQDNSVASAIHGLRTGLDGQRSGLARQWLDLVEGGKPARLFFENVPGIEPWLAEITGRLAGLGYTVSRRNTSAGDCGAPHLRRRVWLVADANGKRLESARPLRSSTASGEPWRTAPGNLWAVADAGGGGMDDGFPSRVAAVRAYGNAIVPAVAAEFIRACAP